MVEAMEKKERISWLQEGEWARSDHTSEAKKICCKRSDYSPQRQANAPVLVSKAVHGGVRIPQPALIPRYIGHVGEVDRLKQNKKIILSILAVLCLVLLAWVVENKKFSKSVSELVI